MRRNANWKTPRDALRSAGYVNEQKTSDAPANMTPTKYSGSSQHALTLLARRTLPHGERAICPECNGVGARVGRLGMNACPNCDPQQRGPCGLHRCKTCQGKGAVCPHCAGMRFVRTPSVDWGGNSIERCPSCCEGNNVSEPLEMRAIQRYIMTAPVGATQKELTGND